MLPLQMEAMQHSMNDRRENNSAHQNHNKSAVQSVEPGKQFSTVRLRLCQRAHSRQNHRRIHKRIQPRHVFAVMISRHSRPQGKTNHSKTGQETHREPTEILTKGQQRARMVFKHVC